MTDVRARIYDRKLEFVSNDLLHAMDYSQKLLLMISFCHD